jgi:hypothetical protein
VTIGVQASGAALVPGSVRQVTFGGRASVSAAGYGNKITSWYVVDGLDLSQLQLSCP